MLHHVTLVRTDVSEELSASFIRVTRISELEMIAVTSNRRTLQCVTWLDIPEDGICHNHSREKVKSYICVVIVNIFHYLFNVVFVFCLFLP
jgi:hypothetical protein